MTVAVDEMHAGAVTGILNQYGPARARRARCPKPPARCRPDRRSNVAWQARRHDARQRGTAGGGILGSATGGVAGRLGCGRHRARESGNPPIGTTRRPTGRPLTNSDRPEMAHAEAEAAEFRQAQAERRGKRLLARLRAAWRREE